MPNEFKCALQNHQWPAEMCFMNHLLWMNALAGGCRFLNVWKCTVMAEAILRSAKKTLLFKNNSLVEKKSNVCTSCIPFTKWNTRKSKDTFRAEGRIWLLALAFNILLVLSSKSRRDFDSDWIILFPCAFNELCGLLIVWWCWIIYCL